MGGVVTKVRDALETVAVLVGNYALPGSSMVTSKLVSKDSQKQLGTDIGVLAQIGTGGAGAGAGNMSNYGKVASAAGKAVGLGESATPAVPVAEATSKAGTVLGSTPATATPAVAPTTTTVAGAKAGFDTSAALATTAVLASAQGAPKIPAPTPTEAAKTPVMPTMDQEAINRVRRRYAARMAKQGGRSSTVLTSDKLGA